MVQNVFRRTCSKISKINGGRLCQLVSRGNKFSKQTLILSAVAALRIQNPDMNASMLSILWLQDSVTTGSASSSRSLGIQQSLGCVETSEPIFSTTLSFTIWKMLISWCAFFLKKILASPLQYLFDFAISLAIENYQHGQGAAPLKLDKARQYRVKLLRKDLELSTALWEEDPEVTYNEI